MKYIIVTTNEYSTEKAIIFDKEFNHSDIFKSLKNDYPNIEVVSGGIIRYDPDLIKNNIQCFGESTTLRVPSRKEDTEIVKRKLNPWW